MGVSSWPAAWQSDDCVLGSAQYRTMARRSPRNNGVYIRKLSMSLHTVIIFIAHNCTWFVGADRFQLSGLLSPLPGRQPLRQGILFFLAQFGRIWVEGQQWGEWKKLQRNKTKQDEDQDILSVEPSPQHPGVATFRGGPSLNILTIDENVMMIDNKYIIA